MKKFVYYYTMKNHPEKIREAAPRHASYWRPLKKTGGPYADFSGGIILFDAVEKDDAGLMVQQDPFVIEDVLHEYRLIEFLAD